MRSFNIIIFLTKIGQSLHKSNARRARARGIMETKHRIAVFMPESRPPNDRSFLLHDAGNDSFDFCCEERERSLNAYNKRSIGVEVFDCADYDEMSESSDEGFFEVFDSLRCTRSRSQEDCLNSFSRSYLFHPSLQSERARYNFQTGLTNTLRELQRSKAAPRCDCAL